MDEEELAAELGLGEEGEVAELEGFGPSFAEELEELASEIETPEGSGSGSGSTSGDGAPSGDGAASSSE